MDILTFISEIVKSLVWPGLVLTAGIAFRKNLKNLIDRLKTIDGTKLDFAAVEIANEQIVALEVQAQPIKEEVKAVEAKIIESENKTERERLVQQLNQENEKIKSLIAKANEIQGSIHTTNYDHLIHSNVLQILRENEFNKTFVLIKFKKLVFGTDSKKLELFTRNEIDDLIFKFITGIIDGTRANISFGMDEIRFLHRIKFLDPLNRITDSGLHVLINIP